MEPDPRPPRAPLKTTDKVLLQKKEYEKKKLQDILEKERAEHAKKQRELNAIIQHLEMDKGIYGEYHKLEIADLRKQIDKGKEDLNKEKKSSLGIREAFEITRRSKNKLEIQLAELQKELDQKKNFEDNVVTRLEHSIANMPLSMIAEKDAKITSLNERIANLETSECFLAKEVDNKDKLLIQVTGQVQDYINSLKQKTTEAEENALELQTELDNAQEQIDAFTELADSNQEMIDDLKKKIKQYDKRVGRLTDTIADLERKLELAQHTSSCVLGTRCSGFECARFMALNGLNHAQLGGSSAPSAPILAPIPTRNGPNAAQISGSSAPSTRISAPIPIRNYSTATQNGENPARNEGDSPWTGENSAQIPPFKGPNGGNPDQVTAQLPAPAASNPAPTAPNMAQYSDLTPEQAQYYQSTEFHEQLAASLMRIGQIDRMPDDVANFLEAVRARNAKISAGNGENSAENGGNSKENDGDSAEHGSDESDEESDEDKSDSAQDVDSSAPNGPAAAPNLTRNVAISAENQIVVDWLMENKVRQGLLPNGQNPTENGQNPPENGEDSADSGSDEGDEEPVKDESDLDEDAAPSAPNAQTAAPISTQDLTIRRQNQSVVDWLMENWRRRQGSLPHGANPAQNGTNSAQFGSDECKEESAEDDQDTAPSAPNAQIAAPNFTLPFTRIVEGQSIVPWMENYMRQSLLENEANRAENDTSPAGNAPNLAEEVAQSPSENASNPTQGLLTNGQNPAENGSNPAENGPNSSENAPNPSQSVAVSAENQIVLDWLMENNVRQGLLPNGQNLAENGQNPAQNAPKRKRKNRKRKKKTQLNRNPFHDEGGVGPSWSSAHGEEEEDEDEEEDEEESETEEDATSEHSLTENDWNIDILREFFIEPEPGTELFEGPLALIPLRMNNSPRSSGNLIAGPVDEQLGYSVRREILQGRYLPRINFAPRLSYPLRGPTTSGQATSEAQLQEIQIQNAIGSLTDLTFEALQRRIRDN